MLRNFITSADLRTFDPTILQNLPREQADWQPQIDEAFEILKDQLRAKSVDVRSLGLPLDLNRAASDTTTKNRILIPATKTASFTAAHILGIDGFRRFVVAASSVSGSSPSAVFLLQGSNDQEADETTTPQFWEDITTLTLTEVGEKSALIQSEYRWYRVTGTISGTNPSFTFTASLLESYADRWIVYLSLFIIYRLMSRERSDVWEEKAANAEALFNTSFDSYRFAQDLDRSNTVEPDEIDSQETRFVR